MTLFTKNIGDIKFEDVQAFIDAGYEEGLRVEYKRDISTKAGGLAKEVVAFANTYGGLIIIGVDEVDRKPVGIIGIPYAEGLDERINNIIITSTHPSIICDICIIKFENQGETKAVAIIRIEESDHTPHRVIDKSKTGVYIRVSSQSVPQKNDDLFKEAPLEDIFFLSNRRRKAIETRERILNRFDERFNNYIFNPKKWTFSSILNISIGPHYPTKKIITTKEIPRLVQKYNQDYFIPPVKNQSSNESYNYIYPENRVERQSGVIFSEINSYGLIARIDSIDVPQKDIIEIVKILITALDFSRKIYHQIGFWGSVQINISFSFTRDLAADGFNVQLKLKDSMGKEYESLDKKIELEFLTNLNELEEPIPLLASIVEQIAESFNITRTDIEDLIFTVISTHRLHVGFNITPLEET